VGHTVEVPFGTVSLHGRRFEQLIVSRIEAHKPARADYLFDHTG
jgi:hypothetical protein